MVQAVIRYYSQIAQALVRFISFIRSKISEIVDLVLERVIIWLCRHYERNMGYGYC